MKPGKSSLNPYAAAYIPLSRRNVSSHDIDNNSMGTDPINDVYLNQQQHQAITSSFDHEYNNNNNNTFKGKIIHGSYGSTSSQSNALDDDRYYDIDKEINMEEEFDMGLKYLQMIFSGTSEESLAEVFFANKGDLESTVEMLRQLELDIDDCSELLPESLDIGDVTEPGSSSGMHAVAGSSSCSSYNNNSHGFGTTNSKSSKKP